jgi:hypothetical protein
VTLSTQSCPDPIWSEYSLGTERSNPGLQWIQTFVQVKTLVLRNQVPADVPCASYMGTSCSGMSRPLTTCNTTHSITLYTHEWNCIWKSALVDLGAIYKYVSAARFRSGMPTTCFSPALIIATDGHLISPTVEETPVKVYLNFMNIIAEERFTVALIHRLVNLEMLYFVWFNLNVDLTSQSLLSNTTTASIFLRLRVREHLVQPSAKVKLFLPWIYSCTSCWAHYGIRNSQH